MTESDAALMLGGDLLITIFEVRWPCFALHASTVGVRIVLWTCLHSQQLQSGSIVRRQMSWLSTSVPALLSFSAWHSNHVGSRAVRVASEAAADLRLPQATLVGEPVGMRPNKLKLCCRLAG